MEKDERVEKMGASIIRYLPLGGLVAALLVCMDGVHVLLPLLPDSGFALSFFVATVASIIVLCLLYTIYGAFTGQRRPASAAWLRFGGVLAAVGFAVAWPLSDVGFPRVLADVCGMACGFGIAAVSLAWCLSLSRLPERLLLRSLSVACMAAGAVKVLIVLLPLFADSRFSGLAVQAILPLALLVSTFAPTQQTAEADVTEAAEKDSAAAAALAVPDDEPAVEGRKEPLPEQARGMLGRNWVIVCGFLLSVTVAAGVWNPLLAQGATGWGVPDTSDSVIGFLLGAVLLLVAVWLLRDETVRILYLVLPLVCVASMVLVWFMRSWGETSGVFSFAPMGFSAAVCGCLHLSRLSSEVRNGLSPMFVYGLFIALAAGVFLVWFGIWPQLGPDGASSADLGFKVIYLVAVAVQMVVLTQRQPVLASKAADIVLSEVCRDLTARFAFSARESEVLFYLIQGRSYAYIAEQQFVSINTIKTHAKRIYAKTGVHSKQELLDLVHNNRG